ncbi:MAG: LysM peptidoglycan-binding domain-containing protein, partial [Firmicutes bacterium]|nr:LysM peptidoglycan-binding domain-containing protein [Bacillota bacterium]
VSVEVVSGDTLWDLARTYGPSDKDVRLVIKDICAINDVSAYTLVPGQNLLIPQS